MGGQISRRTEEKAPVALRSSPAPEAAVGAKTEAARAFSYPARATSPKRSRASDFSAAGNPRKRRRVIADIACYDDLVEAMRLRKERLGITLETLDAVSGVQSGYSGKLLGPAQVKTMGIATAVFVLGAMGLRLTVIEDPALLDRVRPRLVPRMRPQNNSGAAHWRSRRRDAEARP
jgi:hypothetical protein